VIANGWRSYFHPIFAERFRDLREQVETLKRSLPIEQFRSHPRARLFASVVHLVRELVPENPNADEFQLWGDLAKFRRAKGHGLPDRYRLFWVFSSRAKTIIFLYLNDETTLRKSGSKSDPYAVFRRLARQGRLGTDFAANRLMLEEAPDEETP